MQNIRNESKTFTLEDLELISNLEIRRFKGNPWVKQDINVGFDYKEFHVESDPLGIKSFLGATPTLLNASSNTNFIYKVNNFVGSIDDVNQLPLSKKKVQDKIKYILDNGGNLQFARCEKSIFHNNLSLVDGDIPEILSDILLRFYSGKGTKISDLVTDKAEIIKVKRLLEVILLGMFPSKEWDGLYTSNGVIIVRKKGDLLLYHMLKKDILNNYLFYNTKLDTPSTSRHGFGHIYEENGNKYFKLNLQIRNI